MNQALKIFDKPKFSENDLIQSICRESFYEFVKEFWDTIETEKLVDNWHIEFICNEMQIVAERVFNWLPKEYDLIINVPPGSTKSTICSVMFLPWVWTRKPHYKMINGSYTYDLALELSRKSRAVVQSDKYQEVFPEIEVSAEQHGKKHFMNTRQGSRFCVGVGGSVVGTHGYFLPIDDPIDPLAVLSEAELKTVNTWMDETIPSRVVNADIVPIILIMQRLHQDDPTGHMIARDSGKIRHICLPAELTDDVRPKYLRHKYIDGLLDPIRLSRKALKIKEKELGPVGYSGQYLQNPIPRGGRMFDVNQFQYVKSVQGKRFKQVVRYWDKAGTQDGGAYTAGVKMALYTDGSFWVLDVVRGQWRSDIREKYIKNTAIKDGEDVEIWVEQEGGSGGKESAEATIKRLAGFKAYKDIPRGDKASRADPYSVQVNEGNVFILVASWNKDYVEEIQFFPDSKYKDQADASSGAFAKLVRRMVRAGALK